MRHSKLLIAAIVAVAVLGTAASAGSARKIHITNWERGFGISWLSFTVEAGGHDIRCPVAVEGEFSTSTFAKSFGTAVGRITAASLGICGRGRATILRETLPWEVTYDHFGGTLPNIDEVILNVIGFAARGSSEGIECLLRTTFTQPARFIAEISSGRIIGFRPEPNASIPLSGGFLCSFAGEARLSGEAGTVNTRGGIEKITIRLI